MVAQIVGGCYTRERSSKEGLKNHQGTAGKLSLDKHFLKPDTPVDSCNFQAPHIAEPGLMAGRQDP